VSAAGPIAPLEGGGRIDVERFVVGEAGLAGVQVIAGGEIDLDSAALPIPAATVGP